MKMSGFPKHYEQRVHSKILEYFEKQKIRYKISERRLDMLWPLTRAKSALKTALSASPSSSQECGGWRKESSLEETYPSSGESCREKETQCLRRSLKENSKEGRKEKDGG